MKRHKGTYVGRPCFICQMPDGVYHHVLWWCSARDILILEHVNHAFRTWTRSTCSRLDFRQPKLRNLSLSSALVHFRQLQVLNLSHSFHLQDQDIQALVGNGNGTKDAFLGTTKGNRECLWPNLLSLSLSGCFQLTDVSLAVFASGRICNLQIVTSLDLSYCSQLFLQPDHHPPHPWLRPWTGLSRLSLMCCGPLDKVLAHGLLPPHIRALDVSYTLLSDVGLRVIGETVGHVLEVLRCRGCTHLSSSGLLALALGYLTKCRVLDVRSIGMGVTQRLNSHLADSHLSQNLEVISTTERVCHSDQVCSSLPHSVESRNLDLYPIQTRGHERESLTC